jgi:hypothetical protein
MLVQKTGFDSSSLYLLKLKKKNYTKYFNFVVKKKKKTLPFQSFSSLRLPQSHSQLHTLQRKNIHALFKVAAAGFMALSLFLNLSLYYSLMASLSNVSLFK